MRSGDGVSVDEGEELLEDGEEGPVGEDADALLHLQAAVCDRPPVDHAEQPEPHALPLRQQLPGERLVELDGCSVNLRRERGGGGLQTGRARNVRASRILCPQKLVCACVCAVASPTLSPEAEVRTKVEKTGSWYLVFRGQLSTVTPIGRQKTGTESGRGNASRSSSGYRLIRPAAHSKRAVYTSISTRSEVPKSQSEGKDITPK